MPMNLVALVAGFAGAAAQGLVPTERTLVADLRYDIEDHMPLTRVNGIAVGPSGELFVADELEAGIALIDANGTFLRRIGRPGRGPGEFGRLLRIGLIGDTLWAVDSALRRLVFFDLRGDHLRTIAAQNPDSVHWPEFPLAILPQAVLREGLVGSRRSPVPPEGPVVVVLRANGDEARELAKLEYARQSLIVEGSRGISVIRYQPLDDSPFWQVSPDGARVMVVERPAARSQAAAFFTIKAYESDGAALFTTTCHYAPARVPDRVKSEIVRNATAYNVGTFAGSSRDAEAAVRRNLYMPDFYPPIEATGVGEDHTLWLRMHRDNGDKRGLWIIVNANGNVAYGVRGPAGLTIWAASASHVWGVEQDSNGVPQLARYRVTPAADAGRDGRSATDSIFRCEGG